MSEQLQRVCVKIYAEGASDIADDVFVPIFHEWIRDRSLDLVFVDVADYAHVPDSPGIMLITHDASFSLDRADGRFGLLVQRRRPIEGDAGDAIAKALRDALAVASRLEADPRLAKRLAFDRSLVRIESNDRLRAPNTEAGFRALEPFARTAVSAVFPGASATVARITNDARDRLALEVRVVS